ncbi:MAG: ABC transporter ATP-binding protein, partial [Spirochaetes bacterium]|nr:ABC transporter ATP-binding protein [Spirochaetota bacterium]
TLLRLITGIFPPDKGRITIKGRIGSLIAVGAGFHPHMTGRENIFLNGTILGMNKHEIKQKFDAIVDFADISGFLDAPVSTYSSGMRVRLGFSIAVHCDPKILLIDEVLSVGDVSFQNKCLRKISELTKGANAIILVSHNLDHIRTTSDRVILLNKGKIVKEGKSDDVIAEYLKITRKIQLDNMGSLNNLKTKLSTNIISEDIEFFDIGILDINQKKTKNIDMGEDIRIFYEFRFHINIKTPIFGVGLRDSRNFNIVYECNLYKNKDIKIPQLKRHKIYRLYITFKKPNILPGVYTLNIGFRNGDTFEHYQKIISDENKFIINNNSNYNFIIDHKKYPVSTIELDSCWKIEERIGILGY